MVRSLVLQEQTLSEASQNEERLFDAAGEDNVGAAEEGELVRKRVVERILGRREGGPTDPSTETSTRNLTTSYLLRAAKSDKLHATFETEENPSIFGQKLQRTELGEDRHVGDPVKLTKVRLGTRMRDLHDCHGLSDHA